PLEGRPEPARGDGQEGYRAVAAAELRAAVATLPRAQRVAISLAKLAELSLAEASAQSGLSVGALKVATHRALHKLRARLEPA
ncbi:MAG TPA: sigma factor-like helix-turn-helix DNA-binding protein, partial [Crenalkalicoccus sp.]|nr:sigma factor-like helix-turn-helix DNA-binding protein [Crenalkalicoccus sp.]